MQELDNDRLVWMFTQISASRPPMLMARGPSGKKRSSSSSNATNTRAAVDFMGLVSRAMELLPYT